MRIRHLRFSRLDKNDDEVIILMKMFLLSLQNRKL